MGIAFIYVQRQKFKNVAYNAHRHRDRKLASLDKKYCELEAVLSLAKEMGDKKEIRRVRIRLFFISFKLKLLLRKYWKRERANTARRLEIREREYRRQKDHLDELRMMGNHSKVQQKEKHVRELQKDVNRLRSQLGLTKLSFLKPKLRIRKKSRTRKK